MTFILFIVAALAFIFHLYRQSWAKRELEPIYFGEFEGDIYEVGDSYIGVREGNESAQTTIICIPGYVENMRYFQALYADVDCQLIFLNNGDYHFPVKTEDIKKLDWEANPHPLGSIAHDAFRLAQVIRELARTEEIILHGHSRGGAVILDAGRQFSELMQQQGKTISAILEAPVLPAGLLAGNGSKPLVAARDDVLDNASMVASAEQGQQFNPEVNILHTTNTNHFVTLEQPHYLLDLVRDAGQVNSAEIS